MPLELAQKIARNIEIFRQLWSKKQTGHISAGQREELRQTVRAIRTNSRALRTEEQTHEWIQEGREKSRRENQMLHIPGYHIHEYRHED